MRGKEDVTLACPWHMADRLLPGSPPAFTDLADMNFSAHHHVPDADTDVVPGSLALALALAPALALTLTLTLTLTLNPAASPHAQPTPATRMLALVWDDQLPGVYMGGGT